MHSKDVTKFSFAPDSNGLEKIRFYFYTEKKT